MAPSAKETLEAVEAQRKVLYATMETIFLGMGLALAKVEERCRVIQAQNGARPIPHTTVLLLLKSEMVAQANEARKACGLPVLPPNSLSASLPPAPSSPPSPAPSSTGTPNGPSTSKTS